MALTIDDVIAREEIRDLIYRWADAVDKPDFDAFEACYSEDGTVDFKEIGFQGSTKRGHREFLQKSAGLFGKMQHVLTNVIFHELGNDTAKTTHMVTAATAMLDGLVFYTGAYYHDDLVKTADGWRIKHRRAERVYLDNFPGNFVPEDAPGNKL